LRHHYNESKQRAISEWEAFYLSKKHAGGFLFVEQARGRIHLADDRIGVDDGGGVDEAPGRFPRRSLRNTCMPRCS